VLAAAQRGNYRANLIEAFDQPWKRNLEGTVGGYWGLFDDATRQPKFAWGKGVSNHPDWPWQAAGGSAFAVLIFVAAWFTGRRRTKGLRLSITGWASLTAGAVLSGICLGLAVENMVIEGFGVGGWLRLSALVVIGAGTAVTALMALVSGVALPSFASALGRPEQRPRDRLKLAAGLALVASVVLALQTALGLAFDPRYRDFPDAALTLMAAPLLFASLVVPRTRGRRGAAEIAAAAILALCAIYIAFNESFANWQAIWFAAVLLVFAVTLLRVRGAPD
jgi:hypothetical protein